MRPRPFPECLCPDVGRAVTAPWLVSIPWGAQTSGCWHVPMVGTGGCVLGDTGRIASAAMLADTIDEREGLCAGALEDA